MSDFFSRQFYKQRNDFEHTASLRDQRLSMPDGVITKTDISYIEDGNKEHRMDVYYPENHNSSSLPVIINVHGGGLLLGSKEFNRFFCARFSKLGYLVFSIEYRLIPDCQIYDQFQDVSTAFDFIYEHLSDYGGDPNAIYGVADSGGACLLTYTAAMTRCQKLAEAAHVSAAKVPFQALGLISGMFYTTHPDKIGLFLPKYLYGKHYKQSAFGPYCNPEHSDIVNALPPCFLVTSENDYLKHYTQDFAQALARHNISYELLKYPKNKTLTHAFCVFEPELPQSMETLTAMHTFFQKNQS